MDYEAVRAQVLVLLQQEQRLSYRVLKRQLQLDDDTLEDLKEDLIYAKKLAVDEDGRVFVWLDTPGTPAREQGAAAPQGAGARPSPVTREAAGLRPISYTPRHLAERILAEQQALAARG